MIEVRLRGQSTAFRRGGAANRERRTARGGRDSIDHPPGAHDDIANAMAGAIAMLGAKRAVVITDAMLQRARTPLYRNPWAARAY